VAPAPRSRYERFCSQNVRIHLLDDDRAVAALARELERMAPAQVAVDFETVDHRGFGVMNGALRLMQFGFPVRGRPQQVIVDCFRADARPLRDLLASDAVEKLIHNASFERSWAGVHLDTPLNNVYCTLTVWKAIQKHLADLPADQAQALLPGWEPHDNKLGTLVARYIGIELPKGNQRSDWSRRLRPDQLLYAAVDVAVLDELAALTKRVATRLGLDVDLAKAMGEADQRAWKRSRERLREGGGDDDRARQALLRAGDLPGLEAAHLQARQWTLLGPSRDELEDLYTQRRADLRSGQPAPVPAPLCSDQPPF
jgi:hypothetical protein